MCTPLHRIHERLAKLEGLIGMPEREKRRIQRFAIALKSVLAVCILAVTAVNFLIAQSGVPWFIAAGVSSVAGRLSLHTAEFLTFGGDYPFQ